MFPGRSDVQMLPVTAKVSSNPSFSEGFFLKAIAHKSVSSSSLKEAMYSFG